ncbi:hypothetical protein [Flavobacterium sp. 102]|uniref:hypothetical protein n=1 Tax=Flavobacterium sp. 102 TaxID=2135623 RepID=UPI000EB283AA|nr:hypothetical protein [Flavobacterium sp. 102]RKS01207.1 hypothetical protein C8C84_0851 [Flavobacterium sp. 102]
MKINKTVKRIAWSLLGVVVLLFGILVYHIANARPVENATIQISRIDFAQPFDSLSAVAIKEKLHRINGVKSDIIVKENVVVYFHDNTIADSQKVYDELMTKGDYKAERFLLPPSLANKQVCPVMKKDSFKYKFSKFIQGIFN